MQILYLLSAVGETARYLALFFLGCLLFCTLYNMREAYVTNTSRRNRHRQWKNLQERELAMRIARYLPGVRFKGALPMLTSDAGFCTGDEGVFERQIATMWQDDSYFRDMADLACPRMRLGMFAFSPPSDREIYEFYRDFYGNNEIRDDKRNEYYAHLRNQRFVRRDGTGRIVQELSDFNEKKLRQLLTEEQFTLLTRAKQKLEGRLTEGENTTAWEILEYRNFDLLPESDEAERDFEIPEPVPEPVEAYRREGKTYKEVKKQIDKPIEKYEPLPHPLEILSFAERGEM